MKIEDLIELEFGKHVKFYLSKITALCLRAWCMRQYTHI